MIFYDRTGRRHFVRLCFTIFLVSIVLGSVHVLKNAPHHTLHQ